jgi:hypothetical protein
MKEEVIFLNFEASGNGYTNVVKALIKAGANVNHQLNDGSTSLSLGKYFQSVI